jgi:antitoxin component YwqK of YwqJK toxin-antitoxin module
MCPEAAKQLETLDCSNLQFCQTVKGELNLKKNLGSRTVYYHSQEGALAEAQHWVEAIFPLGIRVLCIYGLGLGYYYDALEEWLKINSSRFIVFIEDDLCVIRRFLETKRASKLFQNTQVVIQYFETPGELGWGKFREQFQWFYVGFAQSTVSYQALKLYSEIKEHMFQLIKKQLILQSMESRWGLEEVFVNQELVSKNFYYNLPHAAKAAFGINLFEHFPDIPAIIIGAGPSLNKQLELLKTLHNKAILVASGTAMNVLTRNGLIPHFGYCIDPYDIQESRYMTNLAYEVPIFYSNRFYHKALRLIHGPRLYISLGQGKIEDWFEKEVGLPLNRYESAAISTTNISCIIAAQLGVNPLILTGLDLAYTDSTRYAQGVSGHPIEGAQKHQAEISEEAVSAIGVNGEPIKTRWDWLIEGAFYTEFVRLKPYLSMINATEGGLGIMEIPNLALKDVVNNRLVHTYDIQNWIHSEIVEASKEKFSLDQIFEVMKKWEKTISNCLDLCDKILLALQNKIEETEEDDPLPNLETDEPFASLLKKFMEEDIFKYLLYDCNFSFEHLAAVDMNKLQHFPDHFSQKQKVLIHLDMEKGRYHFFKNILEMHQKALKDSLQDPQWQSLKSENKASKISPERPLDDEGYQFKDGIFSIEDPELKISFRENYSPQSISEERKQEKRENPNAILTIQKGIFEGQALLLYPDGKPKAEFFYLKGQLHGPSTFYSHQGTILARSWFIQGKRVGKSKQYYADGSLYSVMRYNFDGLLQGLQEYFYPSGQLKTLMNYVEGELEGELKLFFPSGLIKREQHFSKGKLHGKEYVWSEQGKLMIESEFKMNMPTGKTIMWHANGQIAKEVTFFEQPLNFTLYMWDEQGKLIHKQISLPENPFEEMMRKSSELQKQIDEAVQTLKSMQSDSAKGKNEQ